jgi:hypothetical protein
VLGENPNPSGEQRLPELPQDRTLNGFRHVRNPAPE